MAWRLRFFLVCVAITHTGTWSIFPTSTWPLLTAERENAERWERASGIEAAFYSKDLRTPKACLGGTKTGERLWDKQPWFHREQLFLLCVMYSSDISQNWVKGGDVAQIAETLFVIIIVIIITIIIIVVVNIILVYYFSFDWMTSKWSKRKAVFKNYESEFWWWLLLSTFRLFKRTLLDKMFLSPSWEKQAGVVAFSTTRGRRVSGNGQEIRSNAIISSFA